MDTAESRYADLEVPEFKSTIPVHLLDKLSDAERFMVETMSKQENQFDFLVRAAREGYRVHIALDKRLVVLEGWKEENSSVNVAGIKQKLDKLWDWHLLLSGKWLVIWAVALPVLPMGLKKLLDLVIVWFKNH